MPSCLVCRAAIEPFLSFGRMPLADAFLDAHEMADEFFFDLAWFQDERDLLGRLDAWRDGWDVVRDFPLFGTGLNTYPDAMLFINSATQAFLSRRRTTTTCKCSPKAGSLSRYRRLSRFS